MIEASTASARSCGVIRSISAAVIIFTGFAMDISFACERLCVDDVRRVRKRSDTWAAHRVQFSCCRSAADVNPHLGIIRWEGRECPAGSARRLAIWVPLKFSHLGSLSMRGTQIRRNRGSYRHRRFTSN
jgi:hypothetical protein